MGTPQIRLKAQGVRGYRERGRRYGKNPPLQRGERSHDGPTRLTQLYKAHRGGAQHRMDWIAHGSVEAVSLQAMLTFEMRKDGFSRRSAFDRPSQAFGYRSSPVDLWDGLSADHSESRIEPLRVRGNDQ
jgi:hypothetical protein